MLLFDMQVVTCKFTNRIWLLLSAGIIIIYLRLNYYLSRLTVVVFNLINL